MEAFGSLAIRDAEAVSTPLSAAHASVVFRCSSHRAFSLPQSGARGLEISVAVTGHGLPCGERHRVTCDRMVNDDGAFMHADQITLRCRLREKLRAFDREKSRWRFEPEGGRPALLHLLRIDVQEQPSLEQFQVMAGSLRPLPAPWNSAWDRASSGSRTSVSASSFATPAAGMTYERRRTQYRCSLLTDSRPPLFPCALSPRR
jgi:hypothetical protein